jgi:hypothetical protein
MTRHSKNCTAGTVYTYHERHRDTKASGYGSKSARFGKDSIKVEYACNTGLHFCIWNEKKTSERIFPVKFHSQAEIYKGCSGRDHMVVGFITTYIVCNRCLSPLAWVWILLRRGVPNTTLCNKVCDLRQVGGFLQVLRFPPPIKLTATI